MQKWIGIGNLTRDVELLITPGRIVIAKFTLAIQRNYKNANGDYEVDYINCIAYRQQAENISKYCHKGDKVCVVGAIQTRNYETADGTQKYVTEVVANEIEYLIKNKNNNQESTLIGITPIDDDISDELPF